MLNNLVTNEGYFKHLPSIIKDIDACIALTKEKSTEVFGENKVTLDWCFCGLMDRSVQLAQGFKQMIRNRNLTCAGALLRLMIDNCLQLYAIYIADDEQDVANHILKGKKVCFLEDRDGNKMTDQYLRTRFTQFDENISDLYVDASSHIHFSSKAISQSAYIDNNTIPTFHVGDELPEGKNLSLIYYAKSFVRYYQVFIQLLNDQIEWKKSFDVFAEEINEYNKNRNK